MSVAPLTAAQLRAQVKSVRERVPDSRVIGIHSIGPWAGPSAIRVGNEDVQIVFCPSTLAVRERLAALASGDPTLVIVTDQTELGADILGRLAKGRLFRVESWRVAMDLFGAREADPRLIREPWIADVLVESAPPEGYRPVPSGVLDVETAWGVILCDRLGFTDAQPDARTLLRWTLDPALIARLEQAPDELKKGVAERLAVTAGSAAVPIMRLVVSGRGRDALPIGLVCRVLFGAGSEEEPRLREAAVRLEPSLDGHSLMPRDGLAWADAAEAVVREVIERSGFPAASTCVDRAEALLRDLRAEDFAYLSRDLASGFEQRLAHFASLLEQAAPGDTLEQAAVAVLSHEHASQRSNRAEDVRMSLRLARRLREPLATSASLAEAARSYVADGAFVDWARACLGDGDASAAVSAAYRALLERATAIREQENRHFAELLREWIALSPSSDAMVPVEAVLSRVVAPLAREAPVLLVVMDGMSLAVFHELMVDLARLGWAELGEGDPPVRRPALAVLPTITNVSRTSLLCGTLRSGNAAIEREGFSSCADLLAVSRQAYPPRLFHKADLIESGSVGLASAVREAIEQPARLVVGVVINAVDDHLARGDQIRMRWGLESFHALPTVLDVARRAGRVVVVTSDHGHVLERGLAHRAWDTGGLRHRADDGRPAPDELALRGPRVLTPSGSVIAPWSERVRYGPRQNGYHGGATPQEVVIPLAVLVADDHPVRGWKELPLETPVWWDLEATVTVRVAGRLEEPVAAPPEPGRQLAAAPAPPSPHQTDFFHPPPTPAVFPERTPAPADQAPVPWIDRLLASSVYVAQKQLAGRVVLEDDRVHACLLALHERGGKLTRAALARALGVPLLRVGGIIAALRRLLNVEGYPVLVLDETSDSVELNRDLLAVQFDLERRE